MNFTPPVDFTCIVNRLGGGGVDDQSSLKLPIIVQVKSLILTYLIIFVTDQFFRSPPLFCVVKWPCEPGRCKCFLPFIYL